MLFESQGRGPNAIIYWLFFLFLLFVIVVIIGIIIWLIDWCLESVESAARKQQRACLPFGQRRRDELVRGGLQLQEIAVP